jgi:transposase
MASSRTAAAPANTSAAGACCRFAHLHLDGPGRVRRYPSDMTDAEWALTEPLLPAPSCTTYWGGGPERYCRRQVVDAIRYLVDNGCKWRALPADFPAWSVVYRYFRRFELTEASVHVLDALRAGLRRAMGRDEQPTAAVIDSQSVHVASTVSRSTSGYDAGKKIPGRKRHIAVDTLGLLICVLVLAGNVQDRDAGLDLVCLMRATCGRVRLIWADSGYAGKLVDVVRRRLGLAVQIVKRTDDTTGFVVQPRRWVVERTFGWIRHSRRTVRDYERLPEHSEAMIRWSAIILMTRRTTRLTT